MKMSILHITGQDADTFLQGQLTCDVLALSAEKRCFTACCDQKGRMLATFWVQKIQNGYALQLPSNMLALLAAHLKKYAIFSKVILEEQITQDLIASSTLYEDVQQGRVYLQPSTSLLFTPQMINLEKNGGVSFTKGCFLGQEIIARTQHLGQLKRHLYQLCLPIEAPIGSAILNPQQEHLGTLVLLAPQASQWLGLAVIEQRALTQALTLLEHPIHPIQMTSSEV